MSSLNFLKNYKSDNEDGSSSSSSEEEKPSSEHIKSILTKFEINAAPVVLYSVKIACFFLIFL